MPTVSEIASTLGRRFPKKCEATALLRTPTNGSSKNPTLAVSLLRHHNASHQCLETLSLALFTIIFVCINHKAPCFSLMSLPQTQNNTHFAETEEINRQECDICGFQAFGFPGYNYALFVCVNAALLFMFYTVLIMCIMISISTVFEL